ncbi:MAG: hypothetical protein HY279_07800 [Nitrospinae bacterium]|nr:hypothetical protein [Nitrospinota bacterium]
MVSILLYAYSIERLGSLFTDVLKLCSKAGLLKVGVVALNGVKIKADAALESNRTYAHIEKEVKKMLSESEAVDAKEDELYERDKRGDEIPYKNWIKMYNVIIQVSKILIY